LGLRLHQERQKASGKRLRTIIRLKHPNLFAELFGAGSVAQWTTSPIIAYSARKNLDLTFIFIFPGIQ
jgi:hypothetical protein